MQRKRQSTISKLFEKIPAAAKIGTSIFLQSLNFEKFIFQALHFWGGGGGESGQLQRKSIGWFLNERDIGR